MPYLFWNSTQAQLCLLLINLPALIHLVLKIYRQGLRSVFHNNRILPVNDNATGPGSVGVQLSLPSQAHSVGTALTSPSQADSLDTALAGPSVSPEDITNMANDPWSLYVRSDGRNHSNRALMATPAAPRDNHQRHVPLSNFMDGPESTPLPPRPARNHQRNGDNIPLQTFLRTPASLANNTRPSGHLPSERLPRGVRDV